MLLAKPIDIFRDAGDNDRVFDHKGSSFIVGFKEVVPADVRLPADGAQCGALNRGMVGYGEGRYGSIGIAPLQSDVLALAH